jgi:alpha-2-macroglobulin
MREWITGFLAVSVFWSMFMPFARDASAQIVGKTMENRLQNTPSGLTFRLSEGVQGAETREKQPPASFDPLNEGDSGKILGRLPAIKSDPDDQTDFAKRIGTLPAPKTGNKIPVKFPADDQHGLPNVDGAKTGLEVVRFTPEGEVPLAPDLSVTFSQPMVAVTSQEEAAKFAPVELTPNVEGRWRWLGTKTLMFDTDKRFPMATKFTARVFLPGQSLLPGRFCRRTLYGHLQRLRQKSNR